MERGTRKQAKKYPEPPALVDDKCSHHHTIHTPSYASVLCLNLVDQCISVTIKSKMCFLEFSPKIYLCVASPHQKTNNCLVLRSCVCNWVSSLNKSPQWLTFCGESWALIFVRSEFGLWLHEEEFVVSFSCLCGMWTTLVLVFKSSLAKSPSFCGSGVSLPWIRAYVLTATPFVRSLFLLWGEG